MSRSHVRVKNAILCEEVRPELGGKNILLGVFSGNINVAEIPATIRLAMYFELESDGPGQFTAKMRMRYADKEPVMGEIGVMIPETTAAAATPMFNLRAEHEGDFIVEISFGDDRWQEVIRKHIAVGDVSSALGGIASPGHAE